MNEATIQEIFFLSLWLTIGATMVFAFWLGMKYVGTEGEEEKKNTFPYDTQDYMPKGISLD